MENGRMKRACSLHPADDNVPSGTVFSYAVSDNIPTDGNELKGKTVREQCAGMAV